MTAGAGIEVGINGAGPTGLAYMPQRLPDELLFSWLSRSHAHHGSPDPVTFTRALFGSRRVATAYDLPSNLDLLSSCLPTRGLLSATTMVEEMTLFPYYAAFADAANREAAMTALLEGDGIRGRALLGMNARGGKLEALRFCPECRDKDVREHGEPYWRRTFQVEPALVCPLHLRILLASDCGPPDRHRYQPATLANCRDDAVPVTVVPDAATTERLAGVALAVERLLRGGRAVTSRLERREEYRRRLVEVGIARGRGDKYGAALATAMRDHWGAALACLGPQAAIGRDRSWPALMATSPDGQPAVRHILLEGFLDAAGDGGYRRDRPFGPGPWPCENPLADHRGVATISECVLGRSYAGGGRAGIFACGCGYVYTRRLMPDGSVRPADRQCWGPLLEPYLRKCASEGTSAAAAAERLGCTSKTVRSLAAHHGLDMGGSGQKYRNSWAGKHRGGWTRAARARPHREGDDVGARRVGGRQARDWDAFDRDLAPRLEAAGAAILAVDPPLRVTMAELAERVGEWPAAITRNLHHMPRSAAVVAKAVEDKEAWDSRRAPMVVRQLRAEWDTLPRSERLRLLAAPGVRSIRAADRHAGDPW